MLTAMIALRQAEIDPAVPADEVEDIDIEEMGFQATYARLAAAGLPSVQVVPFSSVDDAVRDFVIKFSAADAANGGALTARIRDEMSPEAKSVLPAWGVPV
jgi:CAS/CSE protein, C-terminus